MSKRPSLNLPFLRFAIGDKTLNIEPKVNRTTITKVTTISLKNFYQEMPKKYLQWKVWNLI